jgi:hypothetical protein
MKFLLTILALLPLSAFAVDCTTRHGQEFCIGDKITNVSWIDFPYQLHAEIYGLDPVQFKLADGTLVAPKESLGSSWIKTSDMPRCTQIKEHKVCLGDVVDVWSQKNYPRPGSIRKIRIEGITLNGEFLTGIDLGSNKASRIDPMDFVVTKGVLPGFQGYQLGQTFPNAHGTLDRIVGYMPKFDTWYIVELGDSGQRLMVSKKAAEVRFNRVRSIDRADYLQVIETYRTGTKQIDQQFLELVEAKAEAKLKKFCDEVFIDRDITVSSLTMESRKFGKQKLYESFEPRGPFGKYVFSVDPKFTYGLDTKISGTCSY